MNKNTQVYYTWLMQSWLDGAPAIEVGDVFSTKQAAFAAFEEWGEGGDYDAVLVEVKITPVSKLKVGGVVEVPLD